MTDGFEWHDGFNGGDKHKVGRYGKYVASVHASGSSSDSWCVALGVGQELDYGPCDGLEDGMRKADAALVDLRSKQ